MTTIKFIRAALRDLKQPAVKQFFDAIPTILFGMKLEHEQAGHNQLNTVPLKDTKKNLLRTKIPGQKVRVIWEKCSDSKTVICIDSRDKNTYSKDYDQRKNFPCYEWREEVGDAWRDWVYGGYKYSPILTDEQDQIGQELLTNYSPTFSARLIQSPPGTGKTITATGWAHKYHQQGWHVSLIVPQLLIEEIEQYLRQEQRNQSCADGHLKPMTYRDWLSDIQPQFKDQLASAEQEQKAFHAVVKRIHKLNKFGEIQYRDILLYQAYVLDVENKNLRKSNLFQNNQERIKLLKSIQPELWEKELGSKFPRLEAAKQLEKKPPPPPANSQKTLIIIDEAQDYLLMELKAIIAMCRFWQDQHQHQTHLWLLGDLNQRIQPVDFEWGQLEIGKTIQPFNYNYRNSYYILKFANQFLKVAHQHQSGQKKISAEPANPDHVLAEGERIRLLIYQSQEALMTFFKKLRQLSPLKEDEQDRYLGIELAHQVKILRSHLDSSNHQASRAYEFLDISQVKGREFDGSIVLPAAFLTSDIPLAEQAHQWYTLLTRTRTRLLIVTFCEEVEKICNLVPEAFADCESIDADNCTKVEETIQWILEAVGDSEAAERAVDIRNLLLESLNQKPLNLYWDTYSLLRQSKSDLNSWEKQALEYLQKSYNSDDSSRFHAELEQAPDTSLKCLLHRSMHQSWVAVETAKNLSTDEDSEYQRICTCIVSELQDKGLEYEAARVRYLLEPKTPQNLPFPEILGQSGELLSLIADAMYNRLADIVYSH
jgi:hypothetical protein